MSRNSSKRQIPALLTKVSSLPKRATVCEMNSGPHSGVDMSPGMQRSGTASRSWMVDSGLRDLMASRASVRRLLRSWISFLLCEDR